ncbi:hypothetical protein GX441_02000, partial [bacterium]|nr:hypothetical protein [bacterium]
MPKRVLLLLFSGLLFYLQAGWIKTYCPHDASFGDFVENTPDGGYIAAGWDYQAAGYIQ